MKLKEVLDELNFPSKYQNVIDEINLEKANNFTKTIINTIINKYGIEALEREIRYDNSNSKISTHLTHIIEVGGLKIISDNNLKISDQSNFSNVILAVVFILNASLAIELKNLNIYNGNLKNYYNNEAITTIANRLAKHSANGINFSQGFENYATQMIFNNLISELT